MTKKLLIASLLLNLLFISIGGYFAYPRIKSYFKKHYSVVLFGDSLTQFGNWNAVLNKPDFKVVGHPGFTSLQLLSVIGEVFKCTPDTCYLMAGVNDVGVGVPLTLIFKNYNTLIDTLIKHKITPIVQSTLYTVNYPIINRSVDSLDNYLIKLCEAKRVRYIDLNKVMTVNKNLKINLSTDGVHLNEEGYKIWAHSIN
jgi:lysophospholipase L1-like esterase